jgi:hypothetical protein
MTEFLPKIDQRSQEELVSELRRLILYHCPEFGSIEDITADKELDALVNIFANMMGHVNDALNQAPEKNFTAFLNLIGVSPTSPIPARAPLVFKLKDDWDTDGFIPAGTKISAQPENQPEVVFETESDMTVIRPGLVRAVSIEPDQDRWSNQDFLLAKEPAGIETDLFRGDTLITHRMYIGHSELFSLEGAIVNLALKLKENSDEKYAVNWYYFDDKGAPQPLQNGDENSLLENGGISFSGIKEISPKEISGYTKNGSFSSWKNHWIYAELQSPIKNENLLPDVEDIKISVSTFDLELNPEVAVFNYAPIDLTKDFFPFGERPIFNDTFYFACKEAFSKKGAEITLGITLSDAKEVPDTEKITLAWECWNGSKWIEFGRIGKDSSVNSSISDTTYALTTSGTIIFECPKIVPISINGDENYWIRIRIIGGNYGEEGTVSYNPKPVLLNDQEVSITQAEYVKPSFIPPSIKEINISYTYSSPKVFPQKVITENNFEFAEKTSDCLLEEKTFKLFSAPTDTKPALYLGFDRDISNLPISLFFPLTGDQIGVNPIVPWEYWNGRKWLTLSANDAVRDFTRREIQQLAIPSDIEKSPLFGTEHYWIRARLESAKLESELKVGEPKEEGRYLVYPRIDAIYPNAVWAANSNTLQNEILGSSNGEPSQIFQLSRTPVLPGQVVKIQEIIGKSGPIVWEEVQTFSLSGSDSRHYMLDSLSGILTFGDGKNGMIPPAGKENILCDYKFGGGAVGNVKAGAITKMWNGYTGIDAVSNPVAADGGFDQEEIEEAKIRGPHTLKSLDRGITCEDIEWLVREAAPQIALVKCFPTMDRELDFKPGKATVIVVPEYSDPKPVPSQELLSEIDRYLTERIPTVLNTDTPRLDIIGPDYIRVGVETAVKYTTLESGKIIEGRIIDNLKEFLNPLRGGQEKTGWTLGKNLYFSEVCSVIKNTPGVDYIDDITINGSVQCYTLNLEMLKDGPFKPSIPYPTYSAVKSSDNRIVFALAQKLEVNKGVKTLLVKGFREGHKIKLSCRKCLPKELIVESVEGDILECRTFDGKPLEVDYPVGSDIEVAVTQDLKIRSFILNEIKRQSETFFIKIAIPEARDIVYVSRNDEYVNTTPLKIKEVRAGDIFLEEDELVYSGIHLINKKPDLKFPYLLNRDTNIIHDLSSITPQCRIGEILKEDRRYLEKISDANEADTCTYCSSNGT